MTSGEDTATEGTGKDGTASSPAHEGPVAAGSATTLQRSGSEGAGNTKPHRVVIVGGGFGGLAVARSLSGHADIEVTLLDKRNFHLFQPLLYQVATGALSPGDVASPLREALRKSSNATILLGDVERIDVDRRRVNLSESANGPDAKDSSLPYDTLVVAAGLVSNYFGRDEWEAWAPGLKSIEDATEVRSRILLAFEEAERCSDPEQRRALLTFVVVGAGPTGVEMAGAISEIAADTLPVEFRNIRAEKVRVVLLDAGPRVLASFREKLSVAAERDLKRMGVEVRTSTMVRDIDERGVVVEGPATGEQPPVRERIATRAIVWAAGVRGTNLGATLAAATGAELTRQGTLVVQPDLTLAGHPEIFVIGDAACFRHDLPAPLPGVAQVAIQQGRHAALGIVARRRGATIPAFRYEDRGSMATIGRAKAVADLGWTQMTGLPAWIAWLFVHLLFLVGYENRILVLTQWAWYYVWRRRSARLITAWHGGEHVPGGV